MNKLNNPIIFLIFITFLFLGFFFSGYFIGSNDKKEIYRKFKIEKTNLNMCYDVLTDKEKILYKCGYTLKLCEDRYFIIREKYKLLLNPNQD